MNKKRVELYLPKAMEALKNAKIAEQNKKTGIYEIEKTFRGQISSFGAAVSMGSFKSAVAFFSAKGSSSVERQNLIKALWCVTKNEIKSPDEICQTILKLDDNGIKETKEEFLDAAIAVKLAMNAYNLVKKKDNKTDNKDS